jgi:hypothetical protein
MPEVQNPGQTGLASTATTEGIAMANGNTSDHEIKSEKILVKDIFSTMWFRIPEYQRPYIWSKDEVNELLDDLTYEVDPVV